MPLKFNLDEHLRGILWHAVQAHNAAGVDPLDVVRVGDPPDLALGSDDPTILLWAEGAQRILISNDRSTMPVHLANHLAAGHHSPGIFVLRHGGSLQQVVAFLVLAAYSSPSALWEDRIEYIP
jgi:hypothetical protein